MSVHWTHCSLTGASAAWLIPHGCLALLIPAAGLFNVASIDSPSASQGLPALTARRPPPRQSRAPAVPPHAQDPGAPRGNYPAIHPEPLCLPVAAVRRQSRRRPPACSSCMELLLAAENDVTRWGCLHVFPTISQIVLAHAAYRLLCCCSTAPPAPSGARLIRVRPSASPRNTLSSLESRSQDMNEDGQACFIVPHGGPSCIQPRPDLIVPLLAMRG